MQTSTKILHQLKETEKDFREELILLQEFRIYLAKQELAKMPSVKEIEENVYLLQGERISLKVFVQNREVFDYEPFD